MQKLRRMIALSGTLQGIAGEDYTGTLPLVTYIENAAATFPRAYVTAVDSSHRQISGGDAVYSRPSVNLQMSVEVEPDTSLDDLQDQRLKGMDQLLNVLSDVMSLSGVDDSENASSHLNILSATVATIDEVPEQNQGSFGRFFFMDVLIEAGD